MAENKENPNLKVTRWVCDGCQSIGESCGLIMARDKTENVPDHCVVGPDKDCKWRRIDHHDH